MSRERQPWLMPLTLLVAVLLMVMPIAPVLQPLRPAWVAIVLAYWTIESPERSGMALAFVLGLILDVVIGSIIGENAVRLVVITFLLGRFRARIRFFPLYQQALVIGGILFNDQIISWALHTFWRVASVPWWSWLTPVLGMLLWPMVYLAIDSLRLRTWKR